MEKIQIQRAHNENESNANEQKATYIHIFASQTDILLRTEFHHQHPWKRNPSNKWDKKRKPRQKPKL